MGPRCEVCKNKKQAQTARFEPGANLSWNEAIPIAGWMRAALIGALALLQFYHLTHPKIILEGQHRPGPAQ